MSKKIEIKIKKIKNHGTEVGVNPHNTYQGGRGGRIEGDGENIEYCSKYTNSCFLLKHPFNKGSKIPN